MPERAPVASPFSNATAPLTIVARDALGLLHQPARAARQILLDGRQARPDAVLLEQHDVGLVALAHAGRGPCISQADGVVVVSFVTACSSVKACRLRTQ